MIAQPGTPATIVLYTDTVAAVVVRSTEKSVWIQRVERDESTKKTEGNGGGFPVISYQGDLARPIADAPEERYTLRKGGRLVAAGQDNSRGSVRVRLGASVSRTDYSF
jgi:hypothetical protein